MPLNSKLEGQDPADIQLLGKHKRMRWLGLCTSSTELGKLHMLAAPAWTIAIRKNPYFNPRHTPCSHSAAGSKACARLEADLTDQQCPSLHCC